MPASPFAPLCRYDIIMVILAYHIKGELSGIFGIKVTITFRD
jgi:hypothetical protein